MIDYHETLVSALSEVLPTHYEMVLTSNTKMPCISYMEVSNASHMEGDTLGYSTVQYQVSVHARNLKDLQRYALEVDSKLRPLGWTRVSSHESYDGTTSYARKIMTFEALASEEF